MTPCDISIVIPAINEETAITDAIGSAFAAGATEVILVDGGSNDSTMDLARQAGVTKIVRSLPGRGIQLNAGALMVDREYVLFLHADNRLSPNCLEQICEVESPMWGAFRQHIDSERFIFRLIEWGNAWRVRLRGIPFGDQAVFIRKETFDQNGRFSEIPLMEDVDFAKRLRKLAYPVLLDGPVTIDARRWQEHGPIRQTIRNWRIQLAYRFGVSPQRLAKWYR